MSENEMINDLDTYAMASLDWLEPCAVNSPVLASKHDQAELVRVIGQRLREARELCNLSQSEAARQLGYNNPSKLSKVESATDTNSVPLWLIVGAARVYQVSGDFLLGLSENWECGVPRGTQPWLLAAWEKMRQRDLGLMDRLHCEVVTVSCITNELVDAVAGIGEAISAFRAINPQFDEDMRGSNTVIHRLAKAEAAARKADAGLKRFELRLRGKAA